MEADSNTSCPKCGHADSKVIGCKPDFDEQAVEVVSTTYDHRCSACGHVFQTTEAAKASEERWTAAAWQLKCDGLRATAQQFAAEFAEFPGPVGRVELAVAEFCRMEVPLDSKKLAERQSFLLEINRQIAAERRSIWRNRRG